MIAKVLLVIASGISSCACIAVLIAYSSPYRVRYYRPGKGTACLGKEIPCPLGKEIGSSIKVCLAAAKLYLLKRESPPGMARAGSRLAKGSRLVRGIPESPRQREGRPGRGGTPIEQSAWRPGRIGPRVALGDLKNAPCIGRETKKGMEGRNRQCLGTQMKIITSS